MNELSEHSAAVRAPHARPGFWAFIAFMLVLTGLFAGLGVWQMQRLAWKEGLMATVAARMHEPATRLPASGEWGALDIDVYDYRPVSVTGHFVNDQAVLVFIGLSEPKGRYSGPGYWVMTPFAVDGGGVVLVDRGFVPEAMAATYLDDKAAPTGTVTISGVARRPEESGPFTPGPDVAKRVAYARDPARLAGMLDAGLRPLAPIYIDLPAGPAGALPQGGETVVEFPNNHFGYALTWFGFAILTPLMLLAWVYRQYRPEFDITRYL